MLPCWRRLARVPIAPLGVADRPGGDGRRRRGRPRLQLGRQGVAAGLPEQPAEAAGQDGDTAQQRPLDEAAALRIGVRLLQAHPDQPAGEARADGVDVPVADERQGQPPGRVRAGRGPGSRGGWRTTRSARAGSAMAKPPHALARGSRPVSAPRPTAISPIAMARPMGPTSGSAMSVISGASGEVWAKPWSWASRLVGAAGVQEGRVEEHLVQAGVDERQAQEEAQGQHRQPDAAVRRDRGRLLRTPARLGGGGRADTRIRACGPHRPPVPFGHACIVAHLRWRDGGGTVKEPQPGGDLPSGDARQAVGRDQRVRLSGLGAALLPAGAPRRPAPAGVCGAPPGRRAEQHLLRHALGGTRGRLGRCRAGRLPLQRQGPARRLACSP